MVVKYEVTSLLLSALEAENHRLGVDEYVRIHDLISLLPDTITVPQLKTTLTPLLAKNATNQALFYKLFDSINELLLSRNTSNRPLSKNIKSDELTSRITETVKTNVVQKEAESPKEPVKANDPINDPKPKRTRGERGGRNRRNKDANKKNEQTSKKIISNKIKPKLALELKGGDKPPYSWNLDIKKVPQIDTSVQFDRLTGLMRKRSLSETKQLNINYTIHNAVRQLGRIDFVYSQKTEPNEYLFLIELPHHQSHRARLFDALVQLWQNQEIHIQRFFYKGDIRLCWNERQPRGITLSDLQQKFPSHHLFIMGDGFQLLSPATGELARWTSVFEQWKRRAIVTPYSHRIWNNQEQVLAQRFNIAPASLEGLTQLTNSFNEKLDTHDLLTAFNLATPELEPLGFTSDTENEAIIGLQILEMEFVNTLDEKIEDSLLQWIAACAIYPTIEWEWTLKLAELIKKIHKENTKGALLELLTIDNIYQLTRLDWFNKGKMPDDMRRVLIRWLREKHPSVEKHIRQHLEDLMEDNPPKEGSAAVDGFKMMVAVNRLLLNPNAETKANAEATFQELADNGFMPDDFVTLSIINRDFTELDIKLPDEWMIRIDPSFVGLNNEVIYANKVSFAKAWKEIVDAFSNGRIIQGEIKRKAITKIGLIVDVSGIEVFLPGNHVDVDPFINLDPYLGKVMDFKVWHIDEKLKRAVVSHKVLIKTISTVVTKEVPIKIPEIDTAWEAIVEAYIRGTIVKGTVLRKKKGGLIVDVFGRDTFLPGSQVDIIPFVNLDSYIDKVMDFKVVTIEESIKNAVVSHKVVIEESPDFVKEEASVKISEIDGVWEKIVEAFNKNTIIEGTVKERTRGGLLVDINGLEAFLPNHQIDVKAVVDYNSYLGKVMDFKVVKINPAIKNAIISHKSVIETDFRKRGEEILKELQKGQIFKGTVINITDYGAFVDFGGAHGLLYITDISWGRITHPNQVLKLNQEIDVVILNFDDNKKRITLGLKQLLPQPWDVLGSDITEGAIVKGKIVNIEDYGAFLEVQPGFEGLIHVSEATWAADPIKSKEFFKLGQELEAMIVTIDAQSRKMALSIKQLGSDPWERIEDKYAVGTRHIGDVKNITQYGVFVELEHGVGGMIHISDLSWTKRFKHPSEHTKVGDKIEIIILSFDKESRKLALGHKQLENDPWDNFKLLFPEGSIHEGLVSKKDDRGVIFTLLHGLQAFAPMKHIKKEDGTTLEVDEVVNVKVIEFDSDEKRLLVSHTRYLADLKNENNEDASDDINENISEEIFSSDFQKQLSILLRKGQTLKATDLILNWAHENKQEQLYTDVTILREERLEIDRKKTLELLSKSEAKEQRGELKNKLINLLLGYNFNNPENAEDGFLVDDENIQNDNDLTVESVREVPPQYTTTKSELKNLIKSNKISEVIDRLLDWNLYQDNDLSDNISTLSSKLHILNLTNKGIMNDDEWNTEYNELKQSLITLVKDLDFEPYDDDTSLQYVNPKTYLKMLLDQGKTGDVIDRLLTISEQENEELYSDVSLLLDQFTELYTEKNNGTISVTLAKIRLNRLHDSLYKIIKNLESKEERDIPTEE
jgi:ribosomal protein S1